MGLPLRISIVTPSFNQGQFIEETIRSVIDQGYPNLEYIIMDGGSSDETVNIISQFDDHIAYWESTPDEGQSDALQRGFARATGDVLGWLNSDDTLAPEALWAIALAFEDPDVDVVAGVVNVRKADSLIYRHRTGLHAGPLSVPQLLDLPGEWMTGRFFYQPEVYFRKRAYERAGNTIDRSLHYSMDYDLWLRLAEAEAAIQPIDAEIANFRVHASQKTNTTEAFLPELTRHTNSARARHGLAPLTSQRASIERRNLRVGLLNDFGFKYGAGRAHRRMAETLAAAGVDVIVYALREDLDDTSSSSIRDAEIAFRDEGVDLILLGNIHGVFPKGIDLEGLAAIAPVVIVTHDFFWFTGRCPYPMGCDRYLIECPPACPTRDSYPRIPYEEIPVAHTQKRRELTRPGVMIAANSEYAETFARRRFAALEGPLSSPRMYSNKVRRLRIPVPEAAYKPIDRTRARKALSLRPDDFVVLTVAASVEDARKGFQHVTQACKQVADPRLVLLALGRNDGAASADGVRYLGHLQTDDAIAHCFNAADVHMSGSLDETFGQTFVEAALCGCPSIAYGSGAIAECVVEGVTGWTVARNDIAALAGRLAEIIACPQSTRDAVRRRCHLYARSNFGAPSFLADFFDLARECVQNPLVEVSTGVQFDGERRRSIKLARPMRVVPKSGFGLPEGPFPEQGIDRALRWQISPVGIYSVNVPKAGRYSVTVVLGNVAADQEFEITFGGTAIAHESIISQNLEVWTEIELPINLPQGESDFEIRPRSSVADASRRRDLYLAVLDTRILPIHPSASLKTRHLCISPSPGVLPHGIAAPDPNLSAKLRLLSGFATIEGPYPELGVSRRLSWQTDSVAEIGVYGPFSQQAHDVFVELVLPCPQTLVIGLGDRSFTHSNLGPSDWSAPTVIAIANVRSTQDYVTITLQSENSVDDPSGRRLYGAIIDARAEPAGAADQLEPASRLTPNVRLLRGFHNVEGPYPAAGIDRPLAWQKAESAEIEVSGDFSRPVDLRLELVLPLAQSFRLQTNDREVQAFELNRSDWATPTVLTLAGVTAKDGRLRVSWIADNAITDDADRSLYAALVGVTLSE